MDGTECGCDSQDHIYLGKLNLVDLTSSKKQNKAGPYKAEKIGTQFMHNGDGEGEGSGREGPKEPSKIKSLSVCPVRSLLWWATGAPISLTGTPS